MAKSNHPDGYSLRPIRRSTLRLASAELRMFQNPLRQGAQGHDAGDHHQSPSKQNSDGDDGDDEPLVQFNRRESASTSELFYDLWFVANLTVFGTVHEITEKKTLVSFVGYFLLLWNTWFITTVYDARFPQDGILPRLARACHLGVMIGFAIAGAAFDEKDLIRSIIKELSLFLALSRLVLATQYSLVLYHARHNRRGMKVLIVAVVLHLAPAIVYLVIGILSNSKEDQRYIIVWYTVGLLELLSVIIHATLSKTLSFEGTHFNERLELLTLIVLGEGVIILTKNTSKIVEYTYLKAISTHWSPALIGILFSAGAILYTTYQIYVDWMRHHHVPPWYHAIWTFLHLPFHAALVLLAEGSTQWAVWWRAIESYREAESSLIMTIKETIAASTVASNLSSAIAEDLQDNAYSIMKKYGVDWEDGSKNTERFDAKFDVFRSLPNEFWTTSIKNTSDPNYDTWVDAFLNVSSVVVNSISTAFGLASENEGEEVSGTTTSWDEAEIAAIHSTAVRLETIFVYLFLSAGIVLMMLMTMHILSKRKGWSKFNMARTGLIFVIGIGLCLLATIQTNPRLMARFVASPWQLPTIAIAYFCVLILTHLPHPSQVSFKRAGVSETGTAALLPHQEAGATKSDAVDRVDHNYMGTDGETDDQLDSHPYQQEDMESHGAGQGDETQPLKPKGHSPTRNGLSSIQEIDINIHTERPQQDSTYGRPWI